MSHYFARSLSNLGSSLESDYVPSRAVTSKIGLGLHLVWLQIQGQNNCEDVCREQTLGSIHVHFDSRALSGILIHCDTYGQNSLQCRHLLFVTVHIWFTSVQCHIFAHFCTFLPISLTLCTFQFTFLHPPVHFSLLLCTFDRIFH